MASILSEPQFHNEEAAFAYVESLLWPNGPVCPHCGNADPKRVYALKGKTTRQGLRKCAECRKPFTVRIGTVFEDSHCPLRYWLQAIYLLSSSKKGISTRQLQRTLGVGMKTAWFLSHRIREMMKRPDDMFSPPMGGAGKTLEVDEAFIGRKPGTKINVGFGHKNAVLSLVERGGAARSFHIPDIRGETLARAIEIHADKASHLRTDERDTYREIGWNFATHETVHHRANEYARGRNEYARFGDGRLQIGRVAVRSSLCDRFWRRGRPGVFHLFEYQAQKPTNLSTRVYEGATEIGGHSQSTEKVEGESKEIARWNTA